MMTYTQLPRLVASDTLHQLVAYSEMMADRLEGGSWTALSYSSGWIAVTGYPLQVRKSGPVVHLRGMAKFNSGVYTAPVATLPAKFCPYGASQWLQATVCRGSQVVAQPFVNTAGVVSIPSGYTTGTMSNGDSVAFNGSWSTESK